MPNPLSPATRADAADMLMLRARRAFLHADAPLFTPYHYRARAFSRCTSRLLRVRTAGAPRRDDRMSLSSPHYY